MGVCFAPADLSFEVRSAENINQESLKSQECLADKRSNLCCRTKQDLMKLTQKASEAGVGLYWDAVLNQKAGADNTESCQVVEVDPDGSQNISSWQKFRNY